MEYIISHKEHTEMWERTPERQINVAMAKIIEAIEKTKGKIAVAWSGGKDSTLLLYLTCKVWKTIYKDRPLVVVFSDTTNEYRSIYDFLPEGIQWMQDKTGVEIDFIHARPESNFVVEARKGLPLVSKNVSGSIQKLKRYLAKRDLTWEQVKPYCQYGDLESVRKLKDMGLNDGGVLICTGYATRYQQFGRNYYLPAKWQPLMELDIPISNECCKHLKKDVMQKALASKGIHAVLTGEMACDSRQRTDAYRRTGCVNISAGAGMAKPMGAMQEFTVLWYTYENGLPYSRYYGELQRCGDEYCFTKHCRGGCALCGFGLQFDMDRFTKLYKEDYPKCRIAFLPLDQGGLGYKEACEFMNARCGMHIEIPEV